MALRGQPSLARTGEAAFARMDKISAEIFTLTYGAMVNQARFLL